MREITMVKAVHEALAEEMRRDEKVFMIGESIRGSIWEYSAGLVQEFGPERVMDTPIAETAICGAGYGSAMMGYRPVVDLMFADFMYAAADEIFLKSAGLSIVLSNSPTVQCDSIGWRRRACGSIT